ncbi:MAG: nucleotide sugar dehydrogenase [Bacteroidota bacterium]
MKIGVFGLGYVGVVNLACFAKLGHHVIGCDIKSQKVQSVLDGISPVFEPGVNDLLQEGLANGRVHATTDAAEVVKHADIILVCVGTPSRADGKVNLDYTINTTIELAKLLSATNKDLTIAYRSTIPPGSVDGTFRPLLDQHLQAYSGSLKLAFYPEFLREGSAIKDFMHAPRVVVGTSENDISELLELLTYSEEIPVVTTSTETAEFVKYVDNSFHALKIAFTNEVYSIGNQFGIDVDVANEIFLMDRQLNIAPTYLRPGLPFGGSCLPKDLRAMQYFSQITSIEAPVLRHILTSNEVLQARLMDRVLDIGKESILQVGLTFKNHTDDVRESPLLRLAQDIIDAKINLQIYDEDINLTTLRIEQPSIVKYLCNDLEKAIEQSELIIVAKRYMPLVAPLAKPDQIILNLANNNPYPSQAEIHYLYKSTQEIPATS